MHPVAHSTVYSLRFCSDRKKETSSYSSGRKRPHSCWRLANQLSPRGRRDDMTPRRRWQFDSRRIYVRQRTGPQSAHGRRHLRSSSNRTLAVPRTRTTLGDRSFAVAGPRVWNSLPAATIRQITSYAQFRQHLQTHSLSA